MVPLTTVSRLFDPLYHAFANTNAHRVTILGTGSTSVKTSRSDAPPAGSPTLAVKDEYVSRALKERLKTHEGEYRDGYFYKYGKPSVSKRLGWLAVNTVLAPVHAVLFLASGAIYCLGATLKYGLDLESQEAEKVLRETITHYESRPKTIQLIRYPETGITRDQAEKNRRAYIAEVNAHIVWFKEMINATQPLINKLSFWEHALGWVHDVFTSNPIERAIHNIPHMAPEILLFPPADNLVVAAEEGDRASGHIMTITRQYRDIGCVAEWRRLIKRGVYTIADAKRKLEALEREKGILERTQPAHAYVLGAEGPTKSDTIH
ncbi:MAG: hypothetical protein HQM16_12850 [Deltaproteobacteria bacterium]|nr:hypothetical protein [Deltaproteobacteria bacterium]